MSDNLKFNDCTAELNYWSNNLKNECNKYRRYKILYDAVKETLNSDKLESSIKDKISDIILSANVSEVCSIEDSGSQMLLGLDPSNTELTFSESAKLTKLVKSALEQKYTTICNDFANITGQSIDVVNHMDNEGVLELKKQLTAEQELYVTNLQTLQKLLEEIVDLRLNHLPRIADQKVNECELGAALNLLKARMTREKVRVDVFLETSTSLDAYKELIKDIKTQQEDCERDITHLTELKGKYQQVSCQQFDEILKSYIQYKSSIDKKARLLDCFNN